MSDLVGNPEDLFSHKEAHIIKCFSHWPVQKQGVLIVLFRNQRHYTYKAANKNADQAADLCIIILLMEYGHKDYLSFQKKGVGETYILQQIL